MPKANAETRLHIVIGEYLRAVLPREAAETLFHPANGENRSAKTGALLKRMGVKPGVSDWIFLWNGSTYCIEVKLDNDPVRGLTKTYQSPAQKEWQRAVEAAGSFYTVCRSTADVAEALKAWGLPTRETKMPAMSAVRGMM